MKKMQNKLYFLILISLGFFLIGNGFLQGQTAGELFEKALYLEEAQGDLQRAIGLYQNILKQFPKDREISAKAQLHIGLCYEKLGLNEAPRAYQKVLDNYPDQIDAAKVAQEKLAIINKAKTAIEKGNDELNIRKVWEGFNYGTNFYGTVSSDGKYLAFPDWDAGGDLAIRELSSGSTRRITNHNDNQEEKGFASFCVWSPDDSKVAYAWEYNADEEEVLEVVDLDGSKPRILFQEKGKYIMPYTWSPDGKSILVSIERTLSLISVEDGTLQDLKTFEEGASPLFMSNYRFSPDGRYIAYDPNIKGKDGKHRDITLFSIEKKLDSPLVEHPAQDFVIGWTSDGGHFLFGSDRDGSVGVYVLPFSDGKAQGDPEMVKSGLGSLTALGVTNDGSFYYSIGNDFMDIYTTPLEFDPSKVNENPSRLGLPFEGYNRFPQYSPDGNQVVYVSLRGAEPDHVLCIHSIKTGKTEEFNIGFSYVLAPQWSPDGDKILFTGIVKGTTSTAIYQFTPNTGEVTALTTPGMGKAHAGRWSPDGNSIFFFNLNRPSKDSKPGTLEFEIFQCDLQSKNEESIWKFNSANSIYLLLAISPDGERIAFVQRDISEKKDILWAILTSGGTPDQVYVLDRQKNSFDYLEWTADGRHIIFSTEDMQRSVFDLMRISVDGKGEPEKLELAMTELWCFDIHPDGKRVVFASGGKTKKNIEIWVMENFLPKNKSRE